MKINHHPSDPSDPFCIWKLHPDWAVKHQRLIAIHPHYRLNTVGTWPHRNNAVSEPRCFSKTKISFWNEEMAVCQGVTPSTLTFPPTLSHWVDLLVFFPLLFILADFSSFNNPPLGSLWKVPNTKVFTDGILTSATCWEMSSDHGSAVVFRGSHGVPEQIGTCIFLGTQTFQRPRDPRAAQMRHQISTPAWKRDVASPSASRLLTQLGFPRGKFCQVHPQLGRGRFE